MTLTLQPPEKTRESAPAKPSGEANQPPAKLEEKSGQYNPGKTNKDAPAKESNPPVEQQAPIIPFPPPPGAQKAVPPKEAAKPFQIGSILEPALWLIAILVAGALMLAWLKKSRAKQLGAASMSAHDQLTAFRDSMEEGDMTEDEFKKVKALLSEKIRKPANPVTTAPMEQAPVQNPIPPSAE